MSRFVHTAISRLVATYSGNLPAQLTSVETDNSLVAGTLTAPREYISAFEPDRNITPFIMIWEDEEDTFRYTHDGAGQRAGNDFFVVRAHVVLLSNLGQNIQLGSEYLRHYLTAMIEVVENNRSLGVANLETSIESAKVGLVLGS